MSDVSGAGLVNVNTASIEILESLPGIGPVTARAIAAHRVHTPFGSVEDLDDVNGIGPKKLESLRPLVTAGW